MKKILAIDIGGTTAKCALVQRDGSLYLLDGFATGSSMSRPALEKALLDLLTRAGQVDGVGVSTLGIVDRAQGRIVGGVENMPCLAGFRPAEILSCSQPGLPVRVINDATAAALGERWQGAARGCHNFACVAFGTGIGCCLVLNGHPLEGSHHRAGEIGYWDYEDPKENWEQHGSAQSLVRAARTRTGISEMDGVEFFRLLTAGDPVCRTLFENWARRAGRVFANMALLLDMERIVVGGGISAQGEKLTAPLQSAMDSCLPPAFRGCCPIVPAKTGNHAALLGAAQLLLSMG